MCFNYSVKQFNWTSIAFALFFIPTSLLNAFVYCSNCSYLFLISRSSDLYYFFLRVCNERIWVIWVVWVDEEIEQSAEYDELGDSEPKEKQNINTKYAN